MIEVVVMNTTNKCVRERLQEITRIHRACTVDNHSTNISFSYFLDLSFNQMNLLNSVVTSEA